MSASATETLTLPAEAAVINLKPVESTTLVIGSLSTAQDGQYQAIISNASDSSRVERQMVDRLLDGAAFLESDAYSSVYVALSQTEYDSLLPQLTSLFPRLLSSLAPAGQLYITNITSQLDAFTAELRLAGFIVKSTPETDRKTIAAQRPAYTNGTTQTLDTSMLSKYSGSSAPLKSSLSVPLHKFPLTLNRDRASQSSKKALWTLSSPSAATIDPDSLLTAEDRARPVPVCEPVTKGSGSGPRRRKACKNCTCGLAEELEAEAQNSLAVVLDGAVDGAVKEVVNGEFLNGKAKMLPKVTSSCGSCYLGDAFRCSSCPYLGLPAFKPGEKVEINLGMDDI